jgi:hypothetical protein
MASDDDEEYLPSDLDEEAFLNQAYGTDEEAYLLGATTGGPQLAAGGTLAPAPAAPDARCCTIPRRSVVHDCTRSPR